DIVPSAHEFDAIREIPIRPIGVSEPERARCCHVRSRKPDSTCCSDYAAILLRIVLVNAVVGSTQRVLQVVGKFVCLGISNTHEVPRSACSYSCWWLRLHEGCSGR